MGWAAAGRNGKCIQNLVNNLKGSDILKILATYVRIILTLTLLMWRIWRAPTNASKWQMGFNLVFNGLI
jgi:hypothetical protein